MDVAEVEVLAVGVAEVLAAAAGDGGVGDVVRASFHAMVEVRGKTAWTTNCLENVRVRRRESASTCTETRRGSL